MESRRRWPPLAARQLENLLTLSAILTALAGIDHSAQSVAVMSQMSQFFVKQARLSHRAFPSEQELESVCDTELANPICCTFSTFCVDLHASFHQALIYQYSPTYTGGPGHSFEQVLSLSQCCVLPPTCSLTSPASATSSTSNSEAPQLSRQRLGHSKSPLAPMPVRDVIVFRLFDPHHRRKLALIRISCSANNR